MPGKITTWGDIPDDTISKKFLPLTKNLYSFIKKFGYNCFLEEVIPILPDAFYDVLKLRMDETVQTAKATIEGELKHPEITCTYMMYPPTVAMRADLTQGTMKLLYGDSSDLCFYIIDDTTNEVFYLFNAHTEEGIPVDWWFAGPGDELLERRHLMYGYKLRDLNKFSKNFTQTGKLTIDMIKDIRNERTPQWESSSMSICMCYLSAIANLVMFASNIETWAATWDGVNAKRIYKLPDYYFMYYPWPPLLNTLRMLPRKKLTQRIAGLTTNNYLAIQPWEPEIANLVKERSAITYEHFLLSNRKGGIPNPATTLMSKPPDLTKKRTYEQEEFDFIYPNNARYIELEDMGLSVEELIKGVYLDVDFDFPFDETVTPDNIISTGWGLSTVMRKKKIKDQSL